MKNEHNIDELFRQNIQKEYPYDAKLWAQVEGSLPPASTNKTPWYMNLNSILVVGILLLCALIPTDTVKTSVQTIEPISIYSNLNTPSNNITSSNEPNSYEKFSSHSEKNYPIDPVDNNAETSSNLPSYETKQPFNQVVSAIEKQPSVSNNKVNLNKVLDNNHSKEEQFFEFAPSFASKKVRNNLQQTIFPSSIKEMVSLPFVIQTTSLDQNAVKKILGADRIRKTPILPFYELIASTSLNIDKKIEENNNEFVQFKRDNESSIRESGFGINFVKSKKILTYGAGIHKSVYSERISYPLTVSKEGFETIFDTTYTIVNGNYNNNGTIVLLIEEQVSQTQRPIVYEQEEVFTTQNSIKRIQLPFFIGVHKQIGSFLCELRTGLAANYIYYQSGVYINESLDKIHPIESSELNVFMLSNNNSISLGYGLNEFISIGSRLAYHQDISSFTKDYNSRLSSTQLGIWIQWKP